MRDPSRAQGAGPRFYRAIAMPWLLGPLALLPVALLALAGCSGTATALAPPRSAVRSATGGITCQAGSYVCQLSEYGPIGAPCSCPGLGAPSYGTIR